MDDSLPGSGTRYEKTIQLLEDLKAQGARTVAVANRDDCRVLQLCSDVMEVPPGSEYLLPMVEVVPLQLFAYFMALEHGIDVDRPRNLSKAVIEE